MRLLADENFPKPIVDALRARGHDVLWARTDLAGTSDVALLDLAESEAHIVLTLDKDFWQIAVQRRNPLAQSGVVLFRVHPATPERLAPLVDRNRRLGRGPTSTPGRESRGDGEGRLCRGGRGGLR
jgi:predicted nuclease of predicted toxin-antitoxin system